MYKHFKHENISKVQLYDYICKIQKIQYTSDEIRFLVDFAVVLCKQSLRNSVASSHRLLSSRCTCQRTPYGTSEKRALDSLSNPPWLPFKHQHIQGNTLLSLYISSFVHKPGKTVFIETGHRSHHTRTLWSFIFPWDWLYVFMFGTLNDVCVKIIVIINKKNTKSAP